MSKRLLQRGRYPKSPGIDPITNSSSQYPQTTLAQCSAASEVPYYPPVQTQPSQNMWNYQSYPDPNPTYPQNQAPPPVSEHGSYWSGGQMYPTQMQQPSDPWNWKVENNTENAYSNYQPPFEQQQQQQPPIGSSPGTWQQNTQSQVENQNFVPQHAPYNPSQYGYEQSIAQPVESVNNNSNNSLADSALPSWENGSLNITQPAQLPWTYSAPQYSNPTPDLSSDVSSSFAPSNVPWNYTSVPTSDSEIFNQPQPDSLTNDSNVINGAVNLESNVLNSFSSTKDSTDVKITNCVPSSENVDVNNDLKVETEYGSSSLAAFFQNSDQNTSNNSEYDRTSTPDIKNVLDTSSLAENLSQLQINESERSFVPTEDEQDEQNLDDTDDGGNQEVNFVQEENISMHVKVAQSDVNIGFVEEPVNQEVPEPNTDESISSSSQVAQLNQDYHEMSPEEPLNQQIPVESGEKSRSTSSERERVVIRPREESPFKPPRLSSNSKGTVVQQEISEQSIKEPKHPEDKTVVQEVNLETFPDNLERPPDYEELKKQSSFYVSHQKHLRTELNSSPSSLLCDNPDIPCVTLAPAAPPIHSSAKSDKSESSSDSKREMASYDPSPALRSSVKESNTNSPAGLDSEMSDQSMNAVRSSAARDTNERKLSKSSYKNSNHSIPPQQDLSNNEQSKQQSSNLVLKDSKIRDVRNPDYPKQPTPSLENLQNPNNIHDRGNFSSAHSDYSSSRPRYDPRYPQEVDYNPQRFADKKYPSFDERQYYSDRERSRPPSRSSLDERSENYRYPPKPGDYPYAPSDERRRGPADYGRPPSRMSESDMSRPDRHGQYDYYRQQQNYSGAYSRNNDYYQRPTSHRGYEYDPYRRDPYYDYYNAYRYAYSNYNYGFYDELYRNDPRYQQYQEEYAKYYAKYGYEADYERSSVHSGRSSANELSKDTSSNQYLEQDMDSNASEISAYNIRQDYTYDDGPNEISLSAADHSSTPSQRLTPVKFSYAHPIARFSEGGLLITAIPSQATPTLAATIKIQSMQLIMENEESYQELKNYQGPLIRGLTHKNDVVEFCNQKIRVLRKKEDVVDRDSYILLWELMILLLRQNGSVAGSDIAELLLKDHEVLRPHAVPLRHNIETPQSEQCPAEVNDSSSQSHAGDTSSPDEGIVVLHDKSSLNKTVDVDKVTRKFREFLLFGHKKDALEWAMKHGLWGHALFLASKMDLRTYANVMTRFANSLSLNDPLQTLYQLMSGRQPSAVTCVADKKWGDWRPHLAMILSNPSSLPDVDSRSITTLGDTLASRGCLPAAQFCYIMAQVEFGTFEQKNSKLVLLSTDHRLSFEEFATNEAIQCTEIYEYAQSLANPGYLLIHLQMYKFIYALRLVEHGFLEEALHYCEVIAGNLKAHTSLFSYNLISEVFKLATRLKYHDPHFLRGQGEYEDQDDPEWMKDLSILVQNYNNIIQSQKSEVQYEQPSDPNQTVSDQLSPTMDNMSYQSIPGHQSIPGPAMQTDMSNSMNNAGFYQQNNWNQQNTSLPNPPTFNNNQQEMHPYYQSDMGNNHSNFQMESSVPSHEENETTDVPSSPVTQTPPFDYYSGSTQQVSDMKQPSYDQVSSYTTTTRRERRDSALSAASRYSTDHMALSRKSSGKEPVKTEPKTENKPSSQAGKTWLGGIFSRLLPKAPNQMILPDDKNPTIVWDEVQKRWVNKDSNDEDETNAPLAPPTDMELMGSKSSDKPPVPAGNSMPPVATSPVNKFQRPKTRGMRQNYVDILNNSGGTTKTSVPPEALFPAPYEQTATSSSMFVPPSGSTDGGYPAEMENINPSYNNSNLETEEQSRAVLSAPLMFDPAEFDSRRSNANNQRHMIGRTGRRTYPT